MPIKMSAKTLLLRPKDAKRLKLKTIRIPLLKQLCQSFGISTEGTSSEFIERVTEELQDEVIDCFIKKTYQSEILKRKNIISDDELREELSKVEEFSWGIVQGQLDQKIQTEYVRRIPRYDDLIKQVRAKLNNEITSYVVCTWYNHWTTVLIEEHIAQHPRVVPTLKKVKGLDLFFDRQPFDLKVTYLPRDYDVQKAIENPKQLAIWMYEHQGAQRFGAGNRLFVVLLDTNNPNESWKLKRDFDFVFGKIDDFFNKESVSDKDAVTFTFKGKTYSALSKVLMISK